MTTDPNKELVHSWIEQLVPGGGRVLDIGCGEGELLSRLTASRKISAVGLELSEECVFEAIKRGLSVHHGNAEEGLAHYESGSFDVVILSLTIQEFENPLVVVKESLRVGKQVAVVFPNFGHWRARYQLAVQGRVPSTPHLPYLWNRSASRHYLTVLDWEALCRAERWLVAERRFAAGGKAVAAFPNLRAEIALFVLAGTTPPKA